MVLVIVFLGVVGLFLYMLYIVVYMLFGFDGDGIVIFDMVLVWLIYFDIVCLCVLIDWVLESLCV